LESGRFRDKRNLAGRIQNSSLFSPEISGERCGRQPVARNVAFKVIRRFLKERHFFINVPAALCGRAKPIASIGGRFLKAGFDYFKSKKTVKTGFLLPPHRY
jgi:hypothetical protein